MVSANVAATATPAPSRTFRPPDPSAPKCLGAIHDARREEDDELAARVGGATALEKKAEQGDVAEEGDLVEVSPRVARVDAADHGGVPVHDQQIGLGLALQDRRIAAGRCLVEVGLV